MAYAKDTEVPFERSIAEITGLVRSAGADQIGQIEDRNGFVLQFTLSDRMVRFRVTFPSPAEIDAMKGPRQDAARVAAQWRRQRGRALLLVIKAKLESIESGVETFEIAPVGRPRCCWEVPAGDRPFDLDDHPPPAGLPR